MNVTKFIPIVCITLGSASAFGQHFSENDTIYILFQNEGNDKHELGLGVYHEPDEPYPYDVRRAYYISTYVYKKNHGFTTMTRSFYASPGHSLFHCFLMTKKAFYKKDYLDQEWFKKTKTMELHDFFKEKVIYLVDPYYLSDNRFYVMRVEYSDNKIP